MADQADHFTPSWRRPARKSDVIAPSSDVSDRAAAKPFWHRCPCLVCGKPPPASAPSPPAPSHKRCSRCRAAVYCSSRCQKRDYVEGGHKRNCLALGKLWEEKAALENYMWENKNKSTNPFDDEVYDYPAVGRFWHDRPSSSLAKKTTRYCVVLLQLVQLLGRGESWRVATSQSIHRREHNNGNNHGNSDNVHFSEQRRGSGNRLSRELAIDLAYQLLHLDQTDLRVRLLIPSLLLEGAYYQEAYDFLRHWLHADGSLLIMDLTLMGGLDGMGGGGDEGTPEGSYGPTDVSGGGDIVEKPEEWMDGEMVYPSVGMVFELAWLKCHLLCSLRSGRLRTAFGAEEASGKEPVSLAEKCAAAGEEELERQARLLLSAVHKWNKHLLPNLGGRYDIATGASSVDENDASSMAEEGFAVLPATPPAVSTLLNKRPPGFELQYKMGNPGGQTADEAVSIWQRDMILWHDVDPRTMKFLSEFCCDLEVNLLDTSCLTGRVEPIKNCTKREGGVVSKAVTGEDNAENMAKRKEAEALVEKLQRERPDRTMNEIMTHPEMARLMVKHLHTE